ncbi:Ig-like domain-containing protein [Arenimonas daejeonensis]|uniref:Ig-like domain-containing protein n=1 Tax=Arenimonas daejeonensis TaxID=370777 RepID=UPI0011BDB4E0|nr:Ig-like domain-containing protein [Arenimonas daejeonensis]
MHQLLAVRQARRPAPHFRAAFLSLFLLALAWSLPAAAQVTIQPTTIPNPVQGSAYNQQMTASGGTAPYTYTVSSGGLPPGLFYNTAGLIYGTPTTQGTYTFTFGAYDGTAAFGSRSYTVTVQPPAVAGPTATIVVADTALAASETSTVTITFSTAVTGFATGDLTVANGVVSGLASSDGGTTWTATLTPTAGINDPSNVIVLDNAGVTNAGGTPGTGTTTSNNYAIDTQRPTATVVVADTALAAGETSTVTFTFSEAVTGFSTQT